jgi:hypothetical protein
MFWKPYGTEADIRVNAGGVKDGQTAVAAGPYHMLSQGQKEKVISSPKTLSVSYHLIRG